MLGVIATAVTPIKAYNLILETQKPLASQLKQAAFFILAYLIDAI